MTDPHWCVACQRWREARDKVGVIEAALAANESDTADAREETP